MSISEISIRNTILFCPIWQSCCTLKNLEMYTELFHSWWSKCCCARKQRFLTALIKSVFLHAEVFFSFKKWCLWSARIKCLGFVFGIWNSTYSWGSHCQLPKVGRLQLRILAAFRLRAREPREPREPRAGGLGSGSGGELMVFQILGSWFNVVKSIKGIEIGFNVTKLKSQKWF